MTQIEFNTVITKLESFYDKEYNETQLDFMYEDLKNMSVTRFSSICKNLIRTSKFLPKLADILTMDNELPKTTEKKVTENVKECKRCGNTGYLVYTKEVEGRKYDYASLCECGNAPEYKGWECSKDRTKYFIPYAKAIGVI